MTIPTTIPPAELDEFERLTMAVHEAPSLSMERVRNVAALADWVEEHGGNYAFALRLIASARASAEQSRELGETNEEIRQVLVLQDDLSKLAARLGALRIVIAKHRDDLVRLEKSRKYYSASLRGWIEELDEALAADNARQTRLASPSEQAPVVTALGAPAVPIEAVRLLEWFQRRATERPDDAVTLTFRSETIQGIRHVSAGVVSYDNEREEFAVNAIGRAPSLAEAARAALEKVSR